MVCDCGTPWTFLLPIFVDRKHLKLFLSEIQDGHCGRHLENRFFASSPEPKGQLTCNLEVNMGVTCRSKIVKIVPIGNP